MEMIAGGKVPDFGFSLDPFRDAAMNIVDDERKLSVLITVKGSKLTTEDRLLDEWEPALTPRRALIACLDNEGKAPHKMHFVLEGTITNSNISTEKLIFHVKDDKTGEFYRVEYFFKTGEGILSKK